MRLTILSVGYPLAAVSSETAGGAEQILATLDEAFVEAGHRSLVIAPEGSQVRGLLLPTHALSGELDEEAKQNGRSQHRDAIVRALSRFSVDVIHMHGVDYFHYLPEDGPPVAVTLHLPLGWYSSEALAPRRPRTRLICVSKSQYRNAPANAQIDGVIENGVRLGDSVRWGRRKAGYVIAMGRVCPEKGFHIAMDAARDAGYPLWLAGTVYRYPSHQEYFEQM